MSIFKTIADSDIALYVDFRSGSGIDISGNYTTSIGANGYLVHKKLYSANTLGLVSSANVALNKSDFTIIAKHRTVTKLNGHFYTFGTGNDRGLLLYNNVLQTRIDATYYTETLVGTKYDAGGEFVSYGFSADRDANGQFYVNGVAVGTAKNISAKANYDINYSTPILTTYTDNTFETQYILLIKKALTATEMAQLTAELENKKWTSKTKSRAKAKNILVDGDMKALGTSAWSSSAGSGILTKVDNVKRWLRVTNIGNNGQATQRVLVSGKTYRVTGYAVGDGTARPRVYLGNGVYVFIGAAGTAIQYIDVTFTAPDNYFSLMAYGASGFYCDFANIQISEVGNDEVIYKTENGIRADQKTYSTAFIANSNLKLLTGSFKIVDGTYNSEKVKIIECVTNGTFKLPYNTGTTIEFYIDTGAGYVLSNGTGIVSSDVFTLSAGSKIILSSERGTYGIIKK